MSILKQLRTQQVRNCLKMSRRNSLIDPTTIKASGPGLRGGRVGEECKFHIEGTDGGLALSFHIEGPSKPIFETCAGADSSSLDISYIPILPGEYKLSLLWYGKHIDGSPYAVSSVIDLLVSVKYPI